MGPPGSDTSPPGVPGAPEVSLRLAFDAMLELSAFHEVTYGPGGEANDYRILDCNAAFTRVTGISRENAVGRLASEVYRGAPPFLEVYARVAATGEPVRFDSYFAPLDRYFSISVVSPRRGLFVTVASDVTDRERTVQALRRYQLLAEQGLDIVLFVRREDGRILDANEAAVAAYGYSRDQLLARAIYELRVKSDQGLTAAQMASADGSGIRFETVHRRSDGTTFPVEVSSRGAELDGVRILVSVIRDISERRAAHEALASERARLAVTLHSIGDAVIATDEAARITLLNPVAEALTGWGAQEAAGKPLEEVFRVVHEQSRGKVANPVERALREGCTVALANHTALIARDGRERPIADSGAPIRDESGRVAGAVLVFRDQTVERQRERALERSEARYRSLFENLAEEVTIFELVRDPRGEVVDWIVRGQNKRARSALGPEGASLEGKRITEILGNLAAEGHLQLSREVMRTGIPATRELYLSLTRRHYRSTMFALDEGTLVSAALDITERKEAELALSSSESLYRTLFTLAPSGVLLLDAAGRILAFNDRAAEQLGYRRDEFGRLGLADLDADMTPGEIETRIAGVLDGVEHRFAARARTKTGELRSLLVAVCPVVIGTERRLLCVMQDQTEQLLATAALEESEELFRVAFKTSPDALSLNRLVDGVYVAVNQGFSRILGWADDEVLGRSSVDLGIWSDPAERERLVAPLRAQGFVENLEADFRAKDGRVVPGLLSARLVQVRGEPLILSVTRDITSWRRAETERAALRARLEEAARLEAIGQLAGGVAHDFNNLLTVILSCAESARSDLEAGQPVGAEELEEISAAGLRARDLTRQLLAVARRQVISPVALDLSAVVRSCERLLRRVLGEDVELEVNCQPDLWPVRCDGGQIEQIVMNLAVNARDAMPGGGKLTIETNNLAEVDEEDIAANTSG